MGLGANVIRLVQDKSTRCRKVKWMNWARHPPITGFHAFRFWLTEQIVLKSYATNLSSSMSLLS